MLPNTTSQQNIFKGTRVHGDGKTTRVSGSPESGYTVSCIIQPPNIGNLGSASYAGPFSVTKKDDTTVTIAEGYLDLGMAAEIVFPSTDLPVSETGWVYLAVTKSGSYSVAAAFAASIPAKSKTAVYIRLAKVEFSGGKISAAPVQHRYGSIDLPARLFA